MKSFSFKNQLGISVPTAMLVLVTLAISITLYVRSNDASNIVTGAVGEKTNITGLNDCMANVAIQQFQSKANLAPLYTDNDDPNGGYFSSKSDIPVDYTDNSVWTTNRLNIDPNTVEAKTCNPNNIPLLVQYKVVRMCSLPNTAYNGKQGEVDQTCSTVVGTGTSTSNSGLGYDDYNYITTYSVTALYYKIYTRTISNPVNGEIGPKSAVSISESTISF